MGLGSRARPVRGAVHRRAAPGVAIVRAPKGADEWFVTAGLLGLVTVGLLLFGIVAGWWHP